MVNIFSPHIHYSLHVQIVHAYRSKKSKKSKRKVNFFIFKLLRVFNRHSIQAESWKISLCFVYHYSRFLFNFNFHTFNFNILIYLYSTYSIIRLLGAGSTSFYKNSPFSFKETKLVTRHTMNCSIYGRWCLAAFVFLNNEQQFESRNGYIKFE